MASEVAQPVFVGSSEKTSHVTLINVKMDTDINKNESPSSTQSAPKPAESTSSGTIPAAQSNGTLTSKGMDDLISTDSVWTTARDKPVTLRMSNTGACSLRPVTVTTVLRQTVQRIPNHPAFAVKRNGEWKKWTYQQYYSDVWRAAKSFIKLGLEPYNSVGIIGFNSPEWFISDIGAIFAGGFATGIYATNTPEACEFVAKSSKVNIIVVENNQQLQKFMKIKDNLPDLKAIVQYTGEVAQREPFIYSWEEFVKLSEDVEDSTVEERMKQLAPNKCCTLIYTSGTTGNPKGAMLSHDNVTWTAMQLVLENNFQFGQEVLVSYLPLSHIAAQLLDIYMPMVAGATVYFAQPDALKGTLASTLREVHPTGFFGVPRVWEKMMEKLLEAGRQNGRLKKKIALWAKDIGLRGNYSLQNGNGLPFGWKLANLLLFKKVREALGFERCRFFISGAAPIAKETLEFFLSLNVPVVEVYGMSESSGPHTFGRSDQNRVTSVGVEFNGSQTKLANLDEDKNGEICMYGRHVFMGYLNEEEKTKEVIDEEGYLHTGDIGKKDKDGFLYVTGRIKEIIITAGGENVAPVPIEEAVKEALPVVSNCMLIGDKKKFLSMLITLKTEVDLDTLEPQCQLTTVAKEWCRSVGSDAATISDIIDKPDTNVLKAIQAGIDKANSKAVSRATKVQKWSILPKDFSLPGGELGPTLKLRRPIVVKMYTKTIEAFYA